MNRGLGRRAAAAVTVLLTLSAVVVNGTGAITRSAWCWNSTPDVNTATGRLWDWTDPQATAGVRGLAVNGWSAETVWGGSAAKGCDGLRR